MKDFLFLAAILILPNAQKCITPSTHSSPQTTDKKSFYPSIDMVPKYFYYQIIPKTILTLKYP